ncbi:MAG: oxidoreductase [Bacteroidetes bacterium]|nr:oxidoreductase [bacterium]NBP63331.1 oxidoreductase [Bacteroidota bacterium]
MFQVVQYQKNGEMTLLEVPSPQCKEGGILVRTAASLISAGTERTSVVGGQASLLERAKKQPDQVKLVIETLKRDGIKSTINRVQAKLDSYKTLGYSASGIVIESSCEEFSPGDRVACAGAQYAHHAEFISIPKNLAVKLPDAVSFIDASYTTLGAIALQGIRQADLRLGETVAVIGLGLLGQLTVQMLKASGCRVIGLDVQEEVLSLAMQHGCDIALQSNNEAISTIMNFTRGIGTDAVIITASTDSDSPLQLALQISRKKSPIVIVGAVPMNIPRSPFYEKELDLRISCSYGPGRYDPLYEEKGIDYPAGYVRWTEQRNMQAFVDLLEQGSVITTYLTTHTFALHDALHAYDIISGKNPEPHLGIALLYSEDAIPSHTMNVQSKNKQIETPGIGFIGAGSFAQAQLLPPLRSLGVNLHAVSTSNPANALSVAKHFGFAQASTNSEDIIADPLTDIIFCASRHDSHSSYVLSALKHQKPIFVEKPLCINREELLAIQSAVSENNDKIMVGFNRRFSKPFVDIKKFISERTSPLSIVYRVNAGAIPLSSWIQDPKQGGRIIGEACHFIDSMVYLTNAKPVEVFARALSHDSRHMGHHDSSHITIRFSDGSIGTILYLANGDPSVEKEYCEVFCEGKSAIMKNFTTVHFSSGKKTKQKQYDGKKGHTEEVHAFIHAMKSGSPCPISFESILQVTEASIAAVESMQQGTIITL